VKIKFHSNEILNGIACNFILDTIQIQFKRNGVQIGGNGIEKMFVNMVLDFFKRHNFKNMSFYSSFYS
jgi:hypothetical protein